jgi:hypothetical protein
MYRAPGEAFKEDGGDVKDSGLRFVGRSDDGEFRCLVFSELAALRARQVSESADLFLDSGILVSHQNDKNSPLDGAHARSRFFAHHPRTYPKELSLFGAPEAFGGPFAQNDTVNFYLPRSFSSTILFFLDDSRMSRPMLWLRGVRGH